MDKIEEDMKKKRLSVNVSDLAEFDEENSEDSLNELIQEAEEIPPEEIPSEEDLM